MKTPLKHLIVVAGEASGDMHAAHLVAEIKKINPHIRFSGLGGDQMRQQGVELYEDLTQLALIGFVEVIRHYTGIKRIFYLILEKIKETRPDAVILVDYPGFNLRLAAEVKKLGINVIYYISPQVWAWKENRVEKIRTSVDRMLVLFEFEKKFYADRGIDVDFVGHPLIDTAKVTETPEQSRQKIGLDPHKSTLGILPGSRQKEVSTLLPIMLNAARLFHQRFPDSQFLIVKAPTIKRDILARHITVLPFPIKITDGNPYDGINAADACIVASGTATLETAILNKPMVVIYTTSFLTWLLAKLLIKIPYIGLVNVVAGKKIIPECVQFDATPEKIAQELEAITQDKSRQDEIKRQLNDVKTSLGSPGASARAATAILRLLG